jgi:hypothetical protein
VGEDPGQRDEARKEAEEERARGQGVGVEAVAGSEGEGEGGGEAEEGRGREHLQSLLHDKGVAPLRRGGPRSDGQRHLDREEEAGAGDGVGEGGGDRRPQGDNRQQQQHRLDEGVDEEEDAERDGEEALDLQGREAHEDEGDGDGCGEARENRSAAGPSLGWAGATGESHSGKKSAKGLSGARTCRTDSGRWSVHAASTATPYTKTPTEVPTSTMTLIVAAEGKKK